MKPLLRLLGVLTCIFALLLLGFHISCEKASDRRRQRSNVTVNRINHSLCALLSDGQTEPEQCIAANWDAWRSEYGNEMPESVTFLPAEQDSEPFLTETAIDTVICSVRSSSGELLGFAAYEYPDPLPGRIRLTGTLLILICWLLTSAAALLIHIRVLMPFRQLTDYPVRIAKIDTAAKLPESRNRMFGKFIWGMNMLSDVLNSSRKNVARLESERQSLLASLAHGVKTPAANIRLYAEAIGTGLYDGTEGPSVTEIAERIEQNVDKIEKLTAEMIAAASASVSSYQPEIARFYLKELAELTLQEYTERMKLSHIPFSVSCPQNPMIESDKYGLFRIISQFIENAVKYGDGTGISVLMQREDDILSIAVRNKGTLLPESELPFVCRCYWRGSNAKGYDGSGIGLYISQKMASALGGRLTARRLPESGEMEFSVCLE